MTAKVVKTSNRGSKPGERRGGRKKGTPNKATAAIKELASQYTERALLTLAEVMSDPEQPGAARNGAAIALLDRAHGKPSQSVDVTGDMQFTGLEVIVRKSGD